LAGRESQHDAVDDHRHQIGGAEHDYRHPQDREPIEPIDHDTNVRSDAAAGEKSGIRQAWLSVSDWGMTLPQERRGSNDRRILDRRVTIRGERAGAERRNKGERRTGLERRLAILSAEGQIREALRLLTEVIDNGAAPDDELRSLESAMVRLRYGAERVEAKEDRPRRAPVATLFRRQASKGVTTRKERPMFAYATHSISPRLGPCAAGPAVVALTRDYCLHDPAGRLLGTIAAPVRRPEIGAAAPTFYLRRSN